MSYVIAIPGEAPDGWVVKAEGERARELIESMGGVIDVRAIVKVNAVIDQDGEIVRLFSAASEPEALEHQQDGYRVVPAQVRPIPLAP